LTEQIGLADALETLCGQAFGAKQYYMLGVYLQRAFLILAIAAMPISLLWFALSQILVAVGEDADLARAAQTYMIWSLPSLFACVLLPPLIKFFQMQRAVYELLVCSGVAVAVQIPLCWLIIDKLRVGFVGAAIAGNISVVVQLGCLWAFVSLSPKFEKTSPTMSREVFEDFGEFLWLAIPSATMAW
jgi:MATE family multidrug resistance protein